MTNENEQIISGLNSLIKSTESALEESVEGYSPNKLLSLGKEAIINFKYLYAEILFDKLGESSEFKDIANLYEGLASTISDCEIAIQLEKSYHGPRNTSCSCGPEKIIENTIYFMTQSSTMHAEKTLSAEDFLGIELLIDRIPFKEMPIPDRAEFERVYCKFKEYALDRFLWTA